MATISGLTKGLKAVQNNRQAQGIISEAISEVQVAQRTGNLVTDLRSSLGELSALSRYLESVKDSPDFVKLFQARSAVIVKAYVNVAGAVGEFQARQAVSLAAELGQSAKDVGSGLATIAKDTVGVVGDIGGSFLAGILKGLGPIIVGIVALVVYLKYVKGKI